MRSSKYVVTTDKMKSSKVKLNRDAVREFETMESDLIKPENAKLYNEIAKDQTFKELYYRVKRSYDKMADTRAYIHDALNWLETHHGYRAPFNEENS